ncbi:hypothetical protein [Sphingomonas immobilis]|uniref:Alginate export domain-containing protein n=1 Tax=Sphingomonas immobilis TaxID=3063997 RepID=A0ABT9A1F9_9SPHN|nr:hypothetical protein [Sphingomonas sp. CA1-15]MDO7842557.1 hypothetical protein [Sphingomonas sp. CA1-15]
MTRTIWRAAVAAVALMPAVAAAQDHDHMPGMEMPAPTPTPAPHDHQMADMPAPAPPGSSDGSGTSRNPGTEPMQGLHLMAGDWMLMLHGYAFAAYTDQGGPRGSNEGFVQSMAMITAARDLAPGVALQLRSMLSLDPAMGARGYPNLFATGETANGVVPLIDRQHPHDLFMELSARIDVDVGTTTKLFLYGGPVAEPAIGPSAFMHRRSAQYLPLSPITHHWLDSTHISYGVVTAGIARRHWQIEASGFRGREPDQYRWGIETPGLDSWSVRATWNPSPYWSAQVSHGHIKEPEQLEPGISEERTTASVQYARGGLSALIAFSAKNKQPGRTLPAWLAEVSWDVTRHHTLFGRFENVANDELFPDHADPLHDTKFRVSKVEGGYAYRLPIGKSFQLALGGAVGVYGKPAALDAAYGTFPVSGTVFAKLSLGK